MKRITALLLIGLLLLGGCAAPAEEEFTPNDSPLVTVDPSTDAPEEVPEETPEQAPEQAPEETPETPEAPPENTPEEKPEETPEQTPAPEQGEEENEEEAAQSGDWTTSCMSFNILERNTGSTTYSRPEVRAPWIVETIKKYSPDLVGCQEVTKGTAGEENYDMYTYLTGQMAAMGYEFKGMMDAKGKPGSKVPVERYSIGAGLLTFWKKDRFELKDFGACIYSNSVVRHYQWVKLYDKQEDITILMTNTHLAADNPPRVNTDDDFAQQATELFLFWEKNCKKDMALYATGDYNRKPDTTAYANLMQDRYVNSADYALEADANAWIDHVFINSEVQECIKYHRCTETFEPEGVKPGTPDKRNIQYCASDHYAVISYCTNI